MKKQQTLKNQKKEQKVTKRTTHRTSMAKEAIASSMDFFSTRSAAVVLLFALISLFFCDALFFVPESRLVLFLQKIEIFYENPKFFLFCLPL